MWKNIAKFGKKLVDSGLVESQFGNISIRNDDKMLITRTGVHLNEINRNSVVELDIDKPSDLETIASSETIVHRTIYKNTSALSIIHAHPFFSVIESMLVENETIIPINIEGEYFLHEIPVVKGATGSLELANKTAQALSTHKGVIVFGHGTFSAGKTLEEAYFVTALVEQSCKMKYYFDLAKRSKMH
ncbi:MAG: aldolase [Candidatus Methanoperedens sp.]|nr:aldolase [Candidatus Methanoperedens sp.]